MASTEPQIEADSSRLRIVALVGAIVLLLDQVTKIWAVAALDDGPIDLFWTARFRLIYNTGSAFSLGEGLGRWLGALVIVIVIGVVFYARRTPGRLARMLLGAIAGGAIGNLIDRVARADDGFLSGGVVDFIDFQWWPVFNIADIAVVCGAIGLAALSIFVPEQTDEAAAANTANEAQAEADADGPAESDERGADENPLDGDDSANENRADDNRADEDSADDNRADDNRADDNRADENRADSSS